MTQSKYQLPEGYTIAFRDTPNRLYLGPPKSVKCEEVAVFGPDGELEHFELIPYGHPVLGYNDDGLIFP